MCLNRLTLAFSGAQSHIEPAFRDYYFHGTLKQIRIATLAALVFYGFFGLLDAMVMPERYPTFWMIRWAVVCPSILMVFLFSFTRHANRYLQPVVSAGTLVCGFGIIAMIHLTGAKQSYTYVAGLVQTIFYIFTFVRLRFIWATGVAYILVIAFFLCTLLSNATPGNLVVSRGFHLSLICLMGMMAGYAIEYHTRKNFFLARALESKKRRLAIANQNLEERVSKRTAELKHTNQLLKDEITERKMIEAALRDNQKRYRQMVNNVTDYICVYDLNGRILEANRQMTSGLGYAFEELAALKYEDLIHPEDRPAYFEYLIDIRRQGIAVGTMSMMTREGESRQFEYSNVLAEHTTGHQAIFSLARDITDRKKAEKALADSQTRFQHIFETAAAGMAIVDAQTHTVVEINSAATQMVGDPIYAIKDRNIFKLLTLSKGTDFSRLPVPTPYPMECLLKSVNGGTLPVLTSAQETVFNDRPHWIISFINIRKIKEAEATKRELEARAQRAQHLESIGTLAGGIAHDFNNILFGIMGFAELALEEAVPGSIQAKNLEEIINGGHRAKDMIYQILTFSRQDSVEKRPIQPAPLIKEALKLLRASLPASIEIRSRFSRHLNKIMANPSHLHQVVMNLCTNAAHAVKDHDGLIEISVVDKTVSEQTSLPHGTISPGDYVQLIVKDNGEGIQPEIMDRIFEPFFTTKPQGKGTGMGLSVVLGIVQAGGGSILVDSDPGKGTCFELLFPTVQEHDSNTKTPAAAIPGGAEHIMVVDDESSLCLMINRLLTGLGYQVSAYEHPTPALDLFKNQSQAYDLVITDLTMPKMSGIKLAQKMMKIRPDIPVILITGNGNKISQKGLYDAGVRELLFKPIVKSELAAAIRRGLDAN